MIWIGKVTALLLSTIPGGATGSYVRIPAGTFEMGCVATDTRCEPNESPRHPVTLTRDYWLAITETTVAQFRRFVRATGYLTLAERAGRGRYWNPAKDDWEWQPGLTWERPYHRRHRAPDNWPVVQVAWADADAYCRWAGGRLPTEAEWERAARGGRDGLIHVWGNSFRPVVDGVPQINGPDLSTARRFPTFSHFSDYDDGYERAAPVASFPANAFGLHDMAGNTYEWLADWMHDGPYAPGAVIDPTGLPAGEIKALRGAGWGYPPDQFRISYRALAGPDFWTATFGFRCARDTPPQRD